jgi:hypothetical protein
VSRLRRGARWGGAAALAAAVTVTGVIGSSCGEAEPSGPFVTLRITRDFGHILLAEDRLPLKEHGTPLRLLEESHDALFSDYSIVAIDGLRGSYGSSLAPERQTAWEVEVNGIEIDVDPDDLPLAPDDVVQFDLGNVEGSADSRATVGAFPQPFTGGLVGYRPTVEVECADGYRRACIQVRQALVAEGVDVSGRPRGQRPTSRRILRARKLQPVIRRARIMVGPWRAWRHRPWPHLVDRGPDYGGVFVRFSSDATSLRLLDWLSEPVRKVDSGTGLIAAMCPSESDILWLVTGVDRQGVDRAARALNAETLRDAFAVAITERGVENLPLPPSR